MLLVSLDCCNFHVTLFPFCDLNIIVRNFLAPDKTLKLQIFLAKAIQLQRQIASIHKSRIAVCVYVPQFGANFQTEIKPASKKKTFQIIQPKRKSNRK